MFNGQAIPILFLYKPPIFFIVHHRYQDAVIREYQAFLSKSYLRQSLAILPNINENEAAKTKLVVARPALETGSPAETRLYLTQALDTFGKLGAQADLVEARALAQQLLLPEQ